MLAAAGRPAMGVRPSSRPAAAVQQQITRPRALCRRAAMRQAAPKCAAASPQWPLRLVAAIQQQPAVLLAVQAVVACTRMVSALRDGVSRAFPQLQNVSKEVRTCQ